MKYTTLTITFILLAMTACSKQNDSATPSKATLATPEDIQLEDHGLKNVVQDNSGKTVLYWYDPMVADKHFDKPGKSPFMDMQLVPKYKEDSNKGGQP